MDQEAIYSREALIKNEVPSIAAERMHRLPPYLFARINALKRKLRQQNIDIIDLGMGNPNDPTPQLIIDKLAEAAQDKRNQRYSVSVGIKNLRKEMAQFYQKHWHVNLDPEKEVIATIGSKEGFSHLCLGCLGPGDTVLVPTPTFPIHIYGPVIAGANVIGLSMRQGLEELLRSIDHTCRSLFPAPKILVLNFPHNPSCATVDREFFKEIVKLAKRHNFYVIHDFAYGMTCYHDYKAPSFLEIPGATDIGVETITLSKGFNMAGWRIGFVLGNKDMIDILSKIKGYYDYGIFQAIQIASVIALRHCEDDMLKQAKIYGERADCLIDGLNKIGWKATVPDATMFAWVPLPEKYKDMGSIEFTMQCLEKANVALAPGRGFGEDGEGYLRIALVENEQRLKQAIRQLKKAFPCD